MVLCLRLSIHLGILCEYTRSMLQAILEDYDIKIMMIEAIS